MDSNRHQLRGCLRCPGDRRRARRSARLSRRFCTIRARLTMASRPTTRPTTPPYISPYLVSTHRPRRPPPKRITKKNNTWSADRLSRFLKSHCSNIASPSALVLAPCAERGTQRLDQRRHPHTARHASTPISHLPSSSPLLGKQVAD
jgi:hypothetical protein